MNTKLSNLLEDLAKNIVLQNDDIRYANSFISRSMFLNYVYNLINQRVRYNNIAMFTSANMLPFSSFKEKNDIVGLYRHKINECDRVLDELLFNALKEEVISMRVERNVSRYR